MPWSINAPDSSSRVRRVPSRGVRMFNRDPVHTESEEITVSARSSAPVSFVRPGRTWRDILSVSPGSSSKRGADWFGAGVNLSSKSAS